MPMVRYERGSDATAARKLARSQPMSSRGARADETPRRTNSIERLRPGDDPRPAIGRLYSEGRTYPHGKPHDYAARETVPKFKGTAPDESQPQFKDERAAHLNDTREAWQRGMGSQSPHPHFDSGPSGNRYRK
jgi:hypothetical protein